jgi:hypothetical protein
MAVDCRRVSSFVEIFNVRRTRGHGTVAVRVAQAGLVEERPRACGS